MSRATISKDNKKIDSSRVVQARRDKGMSQKDLAQALTENSLTGKSITQAAVSLWETTERNIPYKYLETLCLVLNVTEPYLLNLTDDKHADYDEVETQQQYSRIEEPLYKIEYWKLYAYDRQPIYVKFNDIADHPNGWAIYNRDHRAFVFADNIMKEVTLQRLNATFYTRDISRLDDGLFQRKALDWDKFMTLNPVYVSMITTDKEIKALYNGWYNHNENHTALINKDGLVLPYSGLKKSYLAYSLRKKNESKAGVSETVVIE